ncbi:MAG: cupin domain-containing protein [Crocinitomicaceae bacterium]|nr:cupin domain-containing protein [Crocinitomicaceae bacterium]
MDKVITNPITGEKATFLKEHAGTNGEYTKVMVELTPFAKGVPKHYHTRITEEFEVVEGEMVVTAGKEKKTLKSGEKVFVPVKMIHAFRNYTDQPVKFTVEIRPASLGFERSIRVAFGLARDGKCRKSGLPKNMVHLALLAKWGEGMVPWPMSIAVKMLNKKAEKAEKNGTAQELIDKYCS